MAPGLLADLVLWKPAFFGVKPSLVIKGGQIAAAPMGDANASIPTPQPMHYRPMFGALGQAAAAASLSFVSRAFMENGGEGRLRELGLLRGLSSSRGTRTLCKSDLLLNSATPAIAVNPQTYEVRADGEILTCAPAEVLPLAQRYFLF